MLDFLINTYEANLACAYINKFTSINDISSYRNNRLDDNNAYHDDVSCMNYIEEIADYLSTKNGEELALNRYEQEIDAVLYQYTKSEKEEKDIKTKLKRYIKKHRITDEDLVWIDKKNIRLCNWIWYLFHSNTHIKVTQRNTIKNIRLNTNSNTHAERYISIIDFFKTSDYAREDKISLINKLKFIWSEKIITYRKITDFIEEKNIKQSVWAHNYIVKTFKPRFNRYYFNINSEKDYYYIVICYFDGIDNVYEKNDKFTKLKQAWSQKKYREDNNGKKSYSFNMSIDIANKLDVLSIYSNRSKNYIVEELINNEYLKLKK